MAEKYDRFPGFVGRPGQEFLDEVQRCEAETRRAAGENREPNYTNAWLDLCEGKITQDEYEALTLVSEESKLPETPEKESIFKVAKNDD